MHSVIAAILSLFTGPNLIIAGIIFVLLFGKDMPVMARRAAKEYFRYRRMITEATADIRREMDQAARQVEQEKNLIEARIEQENNRIGAQGYATIALPEKSLEEILDDIECGACNAVLGNGPTPWKHKLTLIILLAGALVLGYFLLRNV